MNLSRHLAHIETTLSAAQDWKIESIRFHVEGYFNVVARGWGEREAWFLHGAYVARLLGFSARSEMTHEAFMRALAERLDAPVSGLTALVQLSGAEPWAIAMLYVLGA